MLDWTPAIQALVDGQGGAVQITQEMAATVQSILAELRSHASAELVEIIDAETDALDPSTWSGLMIGGLLERVECRRVAAGFMRLNIGLSGNQATLRWWAEPNSAHQLF